VERRFAILVQGIVESDSLGLEKNKIKNAKNVDRFEIMEVWRWDGEWKRL
jgi:hypothetical protein